MCVCMSMCLNMCIMFMRVHRYICVYVPVCMQMYADMCVCVHAFIQEERGTQVTSKVIVLT